MTTQTDTQLIMAALAEILEILSQKDADLIRELRSRAATAYDPATWPLSEKVLSAMAKAAEEVLVKDPTARRGLAMAQAREAASTESTYWLVDAAREMLTERQKVIEQCAKAIEDFLKTRVCTSRGFFGCDCTVKTV